MSLSSADLSPAPQSFSNFVTSCVAGVIGLSWKEPAEVSQGRRAGKVFSRYLFSAAGRR
jgi:hypothetical protein